MIAQNAVCTERVSTSCNHSENFRLSKAEATNFVINFISFFPLIHLNRSSNINNLLPEVRFDDLVPKNSPDVPQGHYKSGDENPFEHVTYKI